jgi:hypothetical protein
MFVEAGDPQTVRGGGSARRMTRRHKSAVGATCR